MKAYSKTLFVVNKGSTVANSIASVLAIIRYNYLNRNLFLHACLPRKKNTFSPQYYAQWQTFPFRVPSAPLLLLLLLLGWWGAATLSNSRWSKWQQLGTGEERGGEEEKGETGKE